MGQTVNSLFILKRSCTNLSDNKKGVSLHNSSSVRIMIKSEQWRDLLALANFLSIFIWKYSKTKIFGITKGGLDVAELFSAGVNRCNLMLHTVSKKIFIICSPFTLEIYMIWHVSRQSIFGTFISTDVLNSTCVFSSVFPLFRNNIIPVFQ